MADDYQDLGTYERFPLLPNWVSQPESSYIMARWLVNMPGTVDSLTSITDDAPIIFSAKFMLYQKSDEYAFLDFFNDHRGRANKFWIQHPSSCFILTKTANLGGTSINCQPNKAHLNYQGYERVYILMDNGDIITRKAGAVTYDPVDDEVDLELVTALDRDITTTNYQMVGRMLLCRFEEDNITVESHSSEVSEVECRFRELVKEYSDV